MRAPTYEIKPFSPPGIREVDINAPLNADVPRIFILETRNFLPEHMEKLGDFLAREEITRCLRFHLQKDRESYIVVHGMLRFLLGKYLQMHPSTIELEYNAYGKPRLAGNFRNLRFNLSHSGDISVIGIDQRYNLGVDIERINPDIDFRGISRAFFSYREIDYIGSGNEESLDRFYRLWTRKEALLKALGIGISEHLDVEVHGKKHALAFAGDLRDNHPDEHYSIRTFKYPSDYMISIAVGQETETPEVTLLGSERPDFLLNRYF
jgi:4'-phosphopantetheinyl transferase